MKYFLCYATEFLEMACVYHSLKKPVSAHLENTQKIWKEKFLLKKKTSQNNQSIIKPFVKKNIKMQGIVISLKKQVICKKKYKNCDEIKNGLFLWNFKKVNLKW